MSIKNVIFDIGNVIVKWEPREIISKIFKDFENKEELFYNIFRSEIWYELNEGKLSEKEAIKLYKKQLGLKEDILENLMNEVKESQTPIGGTTELIEELYSKNIPLYSITDNIIEILNFLRKKYNFFEKFIDVISSSDIGIRKPNPVIYQTLLQRNNLQANESVFIDDTEKNVQGAKEVGMHGIIFTSAKQCREILKNLGLQQLN